MVYRFWSRDLVVEQARQYEADTSASCAAYVGEDFVEGGDGHRYCVAKDNDQRSDDCEPEFADRIVPRNWLSWTACE